MDHTGCHRLDECVCPYELLGLYTRPGVRLFTCTMQPVDHAARQLVNPTMAARKSKASCSAASMVRRSGASRGERRHAWCTSAACETKAARSS
jgi:hypothetical protein